MDARLEKIFAKPNERTFRRRISLEERAEAVGRERTLTLAEAKAVRYWPEVDLAGNYVRQFRLEGFCDYHEANLILWHLVPVFQGKNLGLWYGANDRTPTIVFKTAEKGVNFTEDPYDKSIEPAELFSLEFQLRSDPSHLRMNSLRSMQSGQAGRALAALYNLTRDLKLPRIEYSVLGSNHAAMRFYFHMDFGAPKDFECMDWVVEIE